MYLYAEFSLLTCQANPSGSAYDLLRRAGYRPRIEYVPTGACDSYLRRLTGHSTPPVLVTDTGEVVASYARIAEWVVRASRAA